MCAWGQAASKPVSRPALFKTAGLLTMQQTALQPEQSMLQDNNKLTTPGYCRGLRNKHTTATQCGVSSTYRQYPHHSQLQPTRLLVEATTVADWV